MYNYMHYTFIGVTQFPGPNLWKENQQFYIFLAQYISSCVEGQMYVNVQRLSVYVCRFIITTGVIVQFVSC